MADETGNSRRRRILPRFLIESGRRLATRPDGAMPISNRLSTWVGIVSAMIGGFIGLNTYQTDVEKKVDQSVAKTFDMIHRFNEPGLSDVRLRVLSYVEAKRYCDARIISRDLIDNDFVKVIDFFDLVHACVDAQLCDRATAERFFTPYAEYQWPILSKIVEDLSKGEQSLRADARFGEGMAAFAVSPSEPPPCDGNF